MQGIVCLAKKKKMRIMSVSFNFERMFPIPSLLQGKNAELDDDRKTAVIFPARLRERNARCVSYTLVREVGKFFFLFFFWKYKYSLFIIEFSNNNFRLYSLITLSRIEKNGRPIFGTYRALCTSSILFDVCTSSPNDNEKQWFFIVPFSPPRSVFS